jgi:hypothetical protein
VELASIFPGVGDAERYIEVEVDGTKISPRLRLLPSAYSFVSGVALRLVANSIEPGMLRDNAVGSAAINAGAVTDAKLGVGAVSTTKIADGAVTEAKLGAAAVSAAKIAANAVGTTQIADSAVTSAKIADSTIATADLANLAVTEAKLGDAAVGTAKLGDKAVTTAKLADGNVTAAKIADANVTLPKLAAGIFSTSTYTLTFGDSSTSHDTGVGATWYPVLSSIYWGDGDLNENGTGDLGGARLFLFQGTWRLRANLRTHVNDANATIRVLWVPRVLIAGSLTTFGAIPALGIPGWQE